jgi:N-methylhydantoinase B
MSWDRIRLDVLGNALLAVAEEMGVVLIKSSYSSNIKERRDCSAALFDAAGRLIAQAEHIPMHLGSLSGIVSEVVKRSPRERLRPGDVFIGNDPFAGGGTHLPDITLASPVFAEGALVGFVANIAHHADGGADRPRSIWEEGLRIPPIKIAEAGRLRDDVLELLLLNFRLPDQRRGDLRAQLAANRVGEERLQALMERYGRAACLAAMEALLDYSERRIRAAIAAVPDGVYRFADVMDDDGMSEDPIPVCVAVTVAGEEIHLDFAGTGPQCAGDINVVEAALLATVYYALKAALDPGLPANGGFHRAIHVSAPPGCLVNARPPAAMNWRTQTCQRIADVVFGALACVLPDRVLAAGNGANTALEFSGTDPRSGQRYVYLETLGGGSGAHAAGDGLDGVQVHITNTSNLPTECLELEYPLLVEEYALVEGSGGPGRHRGGLGIRRTIRVREHTARVMAHMERVRVAPWGLLGGGPGGKGRLVLNPATPEARPLPSKVYGLYLGPGQAISLETPGAGGYGPPGERDPARRAEDIAEGKVARTSTPGGG